jgi:hypothetical protein
MSESTEDDDPDLVTEAEFVDRPISHKARSALHLYYNNASLDEIVTVVGFASIEEASRAIDSAVKAELRGDTKAKDRMRHIANRKLDQLLRSVSAKAANPKHPEHLSAVDKAVKIIDRHIRLYGLDAPTEMIVHNPDSEEIQAWVTSVMAQGQADLEEMDILDVEGEVVEDDDDGEGPVPALVG